MSLSRLKNWIVRTPVLGTVAAKIRWAFQRSFPGSTAYWEKRYQCGGTSGVGSCGRLAQFKAEVVNRFVAEHDVQSVVEFGCGDGGQLSLAEYSGYVGLDVSPKAVELCRERFSGDPTKTFDVYDPHRFEQDHPELRADVALSLDVIYHIVEEDLYRLYMEHLFAAAERYVIVYSSDRAEDPPAPHIRHHPVAAWITEHRPEWSLIEKAEPPKGDHGTVSFCSFFIYERKSA